ncbi:hypothetical protein DXV76_09580 [Rhodobacteraceae bacterium CCMM004]|nr:hypothetical protein DXV76_09580 [Rhodobacteraceae bacterium CCMM004]
MHHRLTTPWARRVGRATLGLSLAATLGACAAVNSVTGRGWQGAEPDVPLPFDAAIAAGEERADFVVTVDAKGASLEQVRETARFEATRYCLLTFGQSDTAWVTDASGDWATARGEGGSLSVQGRCRGR